MTERGRERKWEIERERETNRASVRETDRDCERDRLTGGRHGLSISTFKGVCIFWGLTLIILNKYHFVIHRHFSLALVAASSCRAVQGAYAVSGGLALSSDLFSVSLVYVVLIKQGQAVRQKSARRLGRERGTPLAGCYLTQGLSTLAPTQQRRWAFSETLPKSGQCYESNITIGLHYPHYDNVIIINAVPLIIIIIIIIIIIFSIIRFFAV